MFATYNKELDKIEALNKELTELTKVWKTARDRGDIDSSNKIKVMQDSKRKQKDSFTKPNLDFATLDEFTTRIARIPLVMENGKVNAMKSLEKVKEKDDELYEYIKYTSRLTSRGYLYKVTGVKAKNYCALVPLFMMPHKKYNGVGYQKWNTSENHPRVTLGVKLGTEYTQFKDLVLTAEQVGELRERALMSPSKGKLAPSAWPAHTVQLGELKLPANTMFRHILLQTWMANAQHRTEYMVLDFKNWDNMPEAMDEVFEKEDVIIPNLKPKASDWAEELPW